MAASELEVRQTPKGPFVFARLRQQGQPTFELLSGLIPGWIDALQGRRFMRWGQETVASAGRCAGWWPCLMSG